MSAEAAAGAAVQCPYCHREIAVPSGVTDQSPAGGVPDAPPTEPPPIRLEYAAAAGPSGSQGLAIASMVCGIVGLFAFCTAGFAGVIGLVGLVLGITALYKAKRHPTKYRGVGMAIAGICTGVVGSAFAGLMLVFMLPMLGVFRDASNRVQCAANMHEIGMALFAYDSDYGSFPVEGADWQSLLVNGSYLSTPICTCPSDARGTGPSYYYVPGDTSGAEPSRIMAYEHLTNHDGWGGHILYADGHVEFKDSPEFEELIDAIVLPDGRSWAPHKKEE